MNYYKSFLFFFRCTILFIVPISAHATLPEYINLKNDQFNQQATLGFNRAPEIGLIIAQLKREYNIADAVETGTYKGNTTALLSYIFDNVHSIEINEEYYNLSKKKLQNQDNIQLILGSSETVLKEILPKLRDKKILFYLDAHWQKYWPLLDELEVISKTHKDNCIIIIDDVFVPANPSISYDSYNGQALSYEYVKEKIEKIFSKYSVHYIIPRNYNSRAKLLFLPN